MLQLTLAFKGRRWTGASRVSVPFYQETQKPSQKPPSNFHLDLIGQNCVSWSPLAGREDCKSRYFVHCSQNGTEIYEQGRPENCLRDWESGYEGGKVFQKKVRDPLQQKGGRGARCRKTTDCFTIPNPLFLALKIFGLEGINLKKFSLRVNKMIISQRSFGKWNQWQLIFKITPSWDNRQW